MLRWRIASAEDRYQYISGSTVRSNCRCVSCALNGRNHCVCDVCQRRCCAWSNDAPLSGEGRFGRHLSPGQPRFGAEQPWASRMLALQAKAAQTVTRSKCCCMYIAGRSEICEAQGSPKGNRPGRMERAEGANDWRPNFQRECLPRIMICPRKEKEANPLRNRLIVNDRIVRFTRGTNT